MPRRLRCTDAGYVYHVLNRAVGRATLFEKAGDYAAFEKILLQAHERFHTRLLAYAVLPNHWHLVVWPEQTGELTRYLQWLTVTHVRRWHAHHHTVGTGPIYQGRFKSFPIQKDEHFLTVCRYVERNPLRANLVSRSEEWRWSSLWHRRHHTQAPWLADWPLAIPDDWHQFVNRPETAAELEALRRSVVRGAPFGQEDWQQRTAVMLGLQSSMRARGGQRRTPQNTTAN
jgi:putative transposase